MDFQPHKGEAFAQAFQAVIDEAMQVENQEQTPRDYLGGSRLGEECERKLAYEFHHTPKDPGREFQGKTLRIFDMGHDGEDRMAKYIQLAGFTLLTHRPDGEQFGFATAWNEERNCNTIAGHIDGVITDGPSEFGGRTIKFPCLWENKALGNKSWRDTERKGIIASKPVYYAQMQVYMAYLGLAENPGLFTALNRDTGEIYAELVPFAKAAAQAASDKGVRIVTTRDPEERPRGAASADNFMCKWCDYRSRCWAGGGPAERPEPSAPNWLGGSNG